MIEANKTYLGQMPGGVGAKILCASAPASFSQTQFEFSFNHHHADMGISKPVPAFFHPGNTNTAQSFISAQAKHGRRSCFPLNCR